MGAHPCPGPSGGEAPPRFEEAPWLRRHRFQAPAAGHAARPTEASQAVLVDVGEHAGALVLHAPAEREGLEVEIHPLGDPSRHTHVWVLPRAGRDTTVYAAVFPSLAVGDYAVLAPDGSLSQVVAVAANAVTRADWA